MRPWHCWLGQCSWASKNSEDAEKCAQESGIRENSYDSSGQSTSTTATTSSGFRAGLISCIAPRAFPKAGSPEPGPGFA